MRPVLVRLSALPLIIIAILMLVSGISRAGEVAFDYADVEWVRPVTRSIAVPIAETLCESPVVAVGARNGDIRADDPTLGLAQAIKRESLRPPAKPRCRVVHRTQRREEVVSYQVRYRYAGEDYERTLSYDPGQQLRVRVEVSAGSH
jgi:hypothetical protein